MGYQKEFFERLGFIEIPKDELPAQKIWADFFKKLLSKKVKHVIIYLRSKKVKKNLALKYKLDGHRPTKKTKEIYNGY